MSGGYLARRVIVRRVYVRGVFVLEPTNIHVAVRVLRWYVWSTLISVY